MNEAPVSWLCVRCGNPPEATIHHTGMPPHAFTPPAPREPSPHYQMRPFGTRRGLPRDAVELAGDNMHCPLCRGLLYEHSLYGPTCLDDRTCGWQARYAAGTTHRRGGSLITDPAVV